MYSLLEFFCHSEDEELHSFHRKVDFINNNNDVVAITIDNKARFFKEKEFIELQNKISTLEKDNETLNTTIVNLNKLISILQEDLP